MTAKPTDQRPDDNSERSEPEQLLRPRPAGPPGEADPQEMLQAERDFYKLLVENSNDIAYVADRDGVFTYVSRRALQYGYSPEELVGKPITTVIHPDDIPGALNDFRHTLATGREFPTRFRLLARDGHAFPVEEFGHVIRKNDDVVGLIGNVREISRQVEFEKKLRRSEQKYRTLVENVNIGVYRNTEAGRFLQANPAMADIFGYESVDELMRVRAADLYQCREDREQFLAEVRQSGYVKNRELRLKKKGGTPIWCAVTARATYDDDGRVRWIDGVTEDITERKAAEEQLRRMNRELEEGVARRTRELERANEELKAQMADRLEAEQAVQASEKRLRTITENSPDQITLIDPDGNILFQNHSIIGTAPENLVGNSVYEHLPPDAAEVLKSCAERVIETGRPDRCEFAFRTPDERLRYLETRIAPVRQNGRTVALALNSHDATSGHLAAEALRESEERYRGVFENAPLAFVVWDRHCRITEWNPHAEELFGWSREEVIGQNFFNFIIPESVRERVASTANTLLERGIPISGRNENLTKSGDVLICEWHNCVRSDSAGNVVSVMSLALDVTESTRAEEALRESEERYRMVVEDQTELVCRFLEDGELTFVNNAYCRFFGKDKGELIGHSFFPFLTQADRQSVREQMKSLSREQPVATIEHRIRRHDGMRWMQWTNRMLFDDEGEFVEYQAVGRDMTDDANARRRIEYQAHLLENVTDAIVVADPNCTVTYWNRGAELLFGFSGEEMLGKVGLSAIWPDDAQLDEISAELRKAEQHGDAWSHNRLSAKNRDGETVWVNIRASRLSVEPQDPESWLFVMRDVTEQVALEQRLISNERMATVGTLAMSVSHELNNLLGGLRGLAELAGEDAGLVPRLVDACRAIADRGGSIAGRMSSLARADTAGEESRIDIPNVARTVVNMMEPALGPRGIVVETEFRPTPPTWANEGAILQILLNLITNARDSIDRDGTIHISVWHQAEDNNIAVAIRDSGRGFETGDIERFFTPFYTTKRGGRSNEPTHLGLGLSESKSLVRQYGGSIDVDGAPGEGATFTLRLPVQTEPSTEKAPEPSACELPPAGTRMLIADDDELIRFWLVEHLAGEGYDIAAVANGREAIEAARRRSFAYVFIDMLMPGEIDGLAAFRELRRQVPEARLIIATAFSPENIPADCRDAAFAILQKPFGSAELARALAGRTGRSAEDTP